MFLIAVPIWQRGVKGLFMHKLLLLLLPLPHIPVADLGPQAERCAHLWFTLDVTDQRVSLLAGRDADARRQEKLAVSDRDRATKPGVTPPPVPVQLSVVTFDRRRTTRRSEMNPANWCPGCACWLRLPWQRTRSRKIAASAAAFSHSRSVSQPLQVTVASCMANNWLCLDYKKPSCR